jgi:two-component system, chemotaxis family, chemotaxis protein CheY
VHAPKILIVEAAQTERQRLAHVLSEMGSIEVVTADSGFGALKLLPRHHFSLIVADIELPDINGLELVNFIRKNPHYRLTPLLIVCPAGSDAELAKGLELGATDCLLRPFAELEFMALVRRHVAHP